MTSPGAPWEPDVLRLRVGDRVQIALSGECHKRHVGEQTGQTGRVQLIWPWHFMDRHPIIVSLDHSPTTRYCEGPAGICRYWHDRFLTRSELRLLERAPGEPPYQGLR